MKKPCVLISGITVSKDASLIAELRKSAEVLTNHENHAAGAILERKKVDLIILEVPGQSPQELEIIRWIKTRFPQTKIIFIDGGREVLATAFQYGVSDAYRKPYRLEMLVERVKALLAD